MPADNGVGVSLKAKAAFQVSLTGSTQGSGLGLQ